MVTAAVVCTGAVLVVRPMWLGLTQILPRALHTRLGGAPADHDKRLSVPEVLVLSWAGTRGMIALAAVFTLPLALADGTRSLPGICCCSAPLWSSW